MLSPNTSIKEYSIRLISRMSTHKKRMNHFMQALWLILFLCDICFADAVFLMSCSARYHSNSSHRRLISVISIAFSLLFIVVFAILAGIILTGIKIALKMYSYINPIIYSEIQKLSLIIAFAPEFFYQILKFCYRHSTIHFAPIFLLKEHHFMH